MVNCFLRAKCQSFAQPSWLAYVVHHFHGLWNNLKIGQLHNPSFKTEMASIWQVLGQYFFNMYLVCCDPNSVCIVDHCLRFCRNMQSRKNNIKWLLFIFLLFVVKTTLWLWKTNGICCEKCNRTACLDVYFLYLKNYI